ncbi:extracellular solute-binding protein family 3 [Desulfitobacterium hafniense DCB-2]|uniref:Extracellular solute-binding protein family 3 n=1 Tax=Desulfitobacterium hafniense (strain DSM 10664 / DCB-2) TaxID=272564 RepID=B8FWT5_DESHD|nr:cysteine ABC transporter substrate-binding protein [Desulfitobacterium hafniense]ACL22583.1 extracellular solute-binding protein family 3 [Desulfitobacterium hafniense DCB-2]
MKKMIRSLALVLAGALLLGGLVGCGQTGGDQANNANNANKANGASSAGSLEEIKQRGTLRIGVFSDKPPFGYVDANGQNQGFDVEIARRFAKDLLGDESKVEFVLVEAANRVPYLESNKVDIIMANFTVTEERKQKVDFANPYMKVALGIVSPNGALITSIDQLQGQKVIVNKGTTAQDYLTKNHPDLELLKYDQNTEAFEALKDGRGAALAHDNTEVLAWAKSNPGFTVGVPTLGSTDTIAPAVKKGDTELLNWINQELAELAKEDFIKKAYEKTLLPVYGDDVKPEELIVEGGKL